MKKILFVIGSLCNGGAERVVSVLANSFIRKYEVQIITLFENKIEYEMNNGIKYYFIMEEDNKRKGLSRNIKRIIKLRKLIEKEKPDCVISFLWAENMITVVSSFFLNQKLILCERNDPIHEPSSKFMRLVRSALFMARKDNYFVFQTEYARKCFPEKVQEKSCIIFNPLNENLPRPYTGVRKEKIVCVARLVKEKNIGMLIRAFRKINLLYPEYELHLYGRGIEEEALRQETVELGISDKVKFRGFLKSVHSEIRDAAMFVLPSNFEGISNAMIEAMAIGLPVICTDCPAFGAREFIVNGKNGYLINTNDESELYKKMLSIIENKDIQESFSINELKIRNLLDSNNICNQWENFIRRNIFHEIC